MPKWNGGVIGVANNPTISSAKGIWSLSEATKAIRAGLWPPSNAGADPYFENVTMLLSGDGTNGAQNNTFLDSSTNNFTITRNGNTTQGTFTPFSKPDGRWGNYFDGNGDYLTVASNAAFGYGTGDFTIEFWYYPTSFAASSLPIILDQRSSTSNEIVPTIYTETNGTLQYFVNGAARITGTALTTNTWYHIAVARSGTSTKMFVNGTQVGSTYTDTNNYVTSNVGIGTIAASPSGYYIFGYLSNLRIVKGTAVYTAAFTTPTAPLTAISGTSLLTCQSNRFIDNSTNAFAITRNGDVSIQTFSPFPTLTAYASGTNGGSGYFDGSGDYLDVASNAALGVGSGDFTLECWIYLTANFDSTGQGIITAAYNTNFALIGVNSGSGNKIDFYVAGTLLSTSTNYINLNAWTHIAAVRSSGTTKIYFDGVEKASSGSLTGTGAAAALYIGTSSHATTQEMTGYISSARLVKGTAVYTAAFTPPTAPLTAITNTSLLLNFTNGGIIDAAMSNVLETVGNAQISTTQSKFGGASMYFDGSGDYLQAPNAPWAQFGSGDFTIEFWMYASSQALAPIVHQTNYASNQGWILWNYDGVNGATSTRKMTFMFNGATTTLTTSSDAYTDSTWTHIAVVKVGTNVKIYSNGNSIASGTFSTAAANASTPLMVGGIINGQSWNGTSYYNGYIDDLRITKGYARYTANFTAPAAPFVGFGD